MKMREQLELNRTLARQYRDALRYTVLGRVKWSEPVMAARVGGMPARMMRVGLMQATAPEVIVHEIDTFEVLVLTPDQVAEWPALTVRKFAGLEEFLREHATVDKAPPAHTSGDAWVREQAAREQKLLRDVAAMAGKRCIWCKEWVSAKEGHNCRAGSL